MLYVKQLLTETTYLNLNSSIIEQLTQIFLMLSPKRQTHLNSVTHLAHQLMNLRMKHDPNYPISGNESEKQLHLKKLLLAYNLHDIGDVPVEISDSFIYTDETANRREQIKQGDWTSSGDYDDEKFNAPIRGYLVAKAIHLALDKNSAINPQDKNIIDQLGFDENSRLTLKKNEHNLLDLIAFVAYHHHEYYDGKGWPRGIKLNPNDSTMDVTFFDFIAGWFVNKMTRGANPRKIMASTPAQVLEAIDKRQAESLRRTPGGEPMYNRFWVEFMREHLEEMNEVVEGIFSDVAEQRKNLKDN